MTKQEEIDILQSLKGDTYFAQFFGSKDIDQMCQNINNDFAIEGGCGFNQKAEALERINADLKKEIQQKIYDLGMELIKDLDKGFDEDAIYQLVKGEVGVDAIIKFKRKNDLELTDKEIDYLVSKLP
ncbi:hypothetical protein [Segatella copri]|jgi:hypothetical protein|uniref:Uncharacterized protein n=1 Tax=Segatella copri TaxID=165179 RepID=A0AAW5TYL7_9BACT|nr:hypothetical protein [Segatella copri]MCW4075993.1 hypothetical protein [Segatella copri]MCW4092398.1 hypothetical protein [Segatella copri]MCW4106934.1 hypothetical protein [Segatella copri]DAG28946.1 MAG TPA: hypothetical protein [Caudoviricetes sp.]